MATEDEIPVEQRRAGMDHDHYSYSPIDRREPLRWPESARVAIVVVLHVESWELVAAEGAVRDPRLVAANGGGFFPETRAWSYREYGNRVGIFRLFDVLDRYRIPVTAAINADAVTRYPNLARACMTRGYELAAHGTHASRMISSRMSETEERGCIAASIEAIANLSGQPPSGWIGQDHGESARTPTLLAEAGLEYVLDWPNDEQPYLFDVGRPLVSLPAQPAFDDVQTLWLGGLDACEYPNLVLEAFQTLYTDGERSGRLMVLGLHPWVMGRPHAIRYLERTLRALSTRSLVWWSTARSVAHWYLRNASST